MPVDWGVPAHAEAAVLASLRNPREEHALALASPRQAELRAVKKEEGREMRTYIERHAVLEDQRVRRARAWHAPGSRLARA